MPLIARISIHLRALRDSWLWLIEVREVDRIVGTLRAASVSPTAETGGES